MSDDILAYFNAEYAAITQLASEFAEAHPHVAARLRLSRDVVDDPHVERLLQGVAFLGARVQQRLDDQFPELAEALLGVLYPHYLAPFPSCMIAQLIPRPDLTGPSVVPRDAVVEVDAIDGTPCRFRTTAPVTLWPLTIQPGSVRLSGLPLPPLVNPLAEGAAGVLRLTLSCVGESMTFERLKPNRVRCYLQGDHRISRQLYELLCGHVMSVAFTRNGSDAQPVILPGTAIAAAGFAPEEALLPWPSQGFAGFRLLAEYFGFPDKFLFVDILGLDEVRGGGKHVDVLIYLDLVPPELEQLIGDSALALGCVPLVNLFRQNCPAMELDWTKTEYRVDPGLRRAAAAEVWSIERVRETRRDGPQRLWHPFFHSSPGAVGPGRSGGAYLPIRRNAANTQVASEVFLSLDDPDFAPNQPSGTQLHVETLCSDINVPRRLPALAALNDERQPKIRLQEGAAGVRKVVALRAPTEALRPPPRGKRFWSLVSHLSLSHLSVVGGEDGAAVLRAVLQLYDLRRSSETRAATESLIAVSAQSSTARVPGTRPGGFCRGVDVRLTFEHQAWRASGLYLLATVVERFLALHGTVNGFVRTTAVLEGRDEPVGRWPARSGTRVLL